MHCLKSGASGTLTFGAVVAEGFCWAAVDVAATFIQWLNVSFWMVIPLIVATELAGTPPPHADRAMGSTKKAPSAENLRSLRDMRRRSVGNAS